MSPSPQNPATTPPAPTITVNGSNLTLPQSVARPMTLQDVQLLQARRSEHGGGRAWNNNWPSARGVVMGALEQLGLALERHQRVPAQRREVP